MEQIFQAVVMGVVQGLTEFLPISSSGHLILVPYLLGWDDPFLESLAFSVVLTAGRWRPCSSTSARTGSGSSRRASRRSATGRSAATRTGGSPG